VPTRTEDNLLNFSGILISD